MSEEISQDRRLLEVIKFRWQWRDLVDELIVGDTPRQYREGIGSDPAHSIEPIPLSSI
ncbi:MAG: hypothetical protein RLZZ140_1160 [Pseudomonadota bacterium]